MPKKASLLLPDSLIVRYFRNDEIDQVSSVVQLEDGRYRVVLTVAGHERTDLWRDLGGGIGFVPDTD